jgi:hypothetical protein
VDQLDGVRAQLQNGKCAAVNSTNTPWPGASWTDSVTICPDEKGKVSGLGIIEKIISPLPSLVFRADGFLVRADAGAQISHRGSVKALADVTPGLWVHFTGKPDNTGTVVATDLEFLSPNLPQSEKDKLFPVRTGDDAPELHPGTRRGESTIVSETGAIGHLQGKFTASESGGGWHMLTPDHDLQQRVRRVGAMVVPDYQRAMPQGDPARINFRFFVVEDRWIRAYTPGKSGVVLVPRLVVERLKSDDQLAVVLADAVAYHLQVQKALIFANRLFATGTSVAEWASTLTMQSLGVMAVGGIVKGISDHEMEVRLEEERGRIILGTLADSGFDPWQAPDVWRILDAKKPPKDVSRLPYARQSKYQLRMLILQYTQGADQKQAKLEADSSASPAR